MAKGYGSVQIPITLLQEVDKILDVNLMGYRSRAEFVSDAIRRHLDHLQDRLSVQVAIRQ